MTSSNKESKSTTCQTDSQPVRAVEKKSTSSQTDKCFQLVDLQELNKSTVSTLQDSFVGAFEKINESVRSLKSNIEDENHLNQRINLLLKENEKLRGINSQEKSQVNQSKKCQSCDDFTLRIDKLNKALEREKENTKSKST